LAATLMGTTRCTGLTLIWCLAANSLPNIQTLWSTTVMLILRCLHLRNLYLRVPLRWIQDKLVSKSQKRARMNK
jgi:hypothetical protein